MTPDRLSELRSKVHHGYNLLASEAREVFEHYGEPIEPHRKRCERCNGEGRHVAHDHGAGSMYECLKCQGTGYEVSK